MDDDEIVFDDMEQNQKKVIIFLPDYRLDRQVQAEKSPHYFQQSKDGI
jgi:hypothetical protein